MKLSRAQVTIAALPSWKQLQVAKRDPLALREHILRTHGRITLHNWIRADHGRAIRSTYLRKWSYEIQGQFKGNRP